jgi:hypothetical protein
MPLKPDHEERYPSNYPDSIWTKLRTLRLEGGKRLTVQQRKKQIIKTIYILIHLTLSVRWLLSARPSV